MECPATRTTRFSHLHPFAFLCIVPKTVIRFPPSGLFIELNEGPFHTLFKTLQAQKGVVLAAVKSLLSPSRRNRNRLETGVFVEEAED
jgi:hypothetical protein